MKVVLATIAVTSVCASLLILYDASDGGTSIAGAIVEVWSAMILAGALSALAIGQLIWNRAHPARRLRFLPAFLGAGLAVAGQSLLMASGLVDHAFEYRFRLSQADLLAYAEGVVAEPTSIQAPVWVGLFRVEETQLMQSPTAVRMITTKCHLLDRCGLVFSPYGPPRRVGEDTYWVLDGPWWFWRESW